MGSGRSAPARSGRVTLSRGTFAAGVGGDSRDVIVDLVGYFR